MATSPSTARAADDLLPNIFRAAMVASVRSDNPDLTLRQLAVFLKVYSERDIEHTVRGLATDLNVQPSVITRALDRLSEFDFIKREKDRMDRRSVIVRRTPTGSSYFSTLSGYMAEASKQTKK